MENLKLIESNTITNIKLSQNIKSNKIIDEEKYIRKTLIENYYDKVGY